MPSESERCVDELLIKLTKIDEFVAKLESDGSRDELLNEARALVTDTQVYLDNNRSLIPAYSLKKVTDSLKRLEKCVDKPQRSKLQFKFKSSSKVAIKDTLPLDAKVPVSDLDANLLTEVSPNKLGFQSLKNQSLLLKPSEVESKDVSLIDLDGCQVSISGLVNTVYIRNLKNTSVTIILACRAITVVNCSNCDFKLVCQQLRIDTTESSEFEIFSSARSMLESSKNLKFKCINLKMAQGDTDIQELFKRANFDESKNNWRCIDDFDWLSPDIPSENFELIEH